MVTNVQRNYKNGLFLMIFGNKPALLRLYNAVRGSDYTNPDDLTVTTIENVLYLGMKNDVAFIVRTISFSTTVRRKKAIPEFCGSQIPLSNKMAKRPV